jgi:hypothetical protein
MKKLIVGVAMVMFAVMISAMPAHATTVADMLVMIEDLEVRVAVLEAGGPGNLEPRVAALETDTAALETALIDLNASTSNVQDLNPFVEVALTTALDDTGVAGPNVYLTGINLHLLDGSGVTYGAGAPFHGHGNLIIGYNEIPGTIPIGPVPNIVGRDGSHCLVLGAENQWISDGSFVGGVRNTIGAPFSHIAAGALNATAPTGLLSFIGAGAQNVANTPTEAILPLPPAPTSR